MADPSISHQATRERRTKLVVGRTLTLPDGGRIRGGVDLTDARVAALCNSMGAHASIALDGFIYGRLSRDEALTDVNGGVRWLNSQLPAHLNRDFRRQPWEHRPLANSPANLPVDGRYPVNRLAAQKAARIVKPIKGPRPISFSAFAEARWRLDSFDPLLVSYFSKPKGSSTECAGWVNQRAPVSVMTMWSSRRTPNSP